MRVFVCNLCGKASSFSKRSMHRELPSCTICSSTIRQRQVIEAVKSVLATFDRPLDVIGLSDHPNIETWFSLQSSLNYTNTFFDNTPFLDISEPDFTFRSYADILISSDILGHVMYPMSKALLGHFSVLKPGGVLILTTPWVTNGPHVEHFPWMVGYQVKTRCYSPTVIGVDSKGQKRKIADPIFHGGPGNTLEIRISSIHVLLEEIRRAGFTDVQVRSERKLEIGIFPWSDMSVIIARRP